MDAAPLIFKVRGLDCAEEVALIKSVLLPLGVQENDLSFDLLNGKLMLGCAESVITSDTVVSSIGSTGLTAIPWDEFIARADDDENFWTRHGRSLFCGLSAATLMFGFISHGLAHSWMDTIGSHGENHSYPTLTKVFYLAAVFFGYWFVAPKAWFAVRRLRADMNLLMTVACIGAILLGEWMEGATVAFLFSFSLVLEAWSVGKARRSISALMDATPDTARIFCCPSTGFKEKSVDEVNVGDLMQVRPGARVPLDGLVKSGHSRINQAPITGESRPVSKDEGDEVYAGSVNGDGLLEVDVTHTAEHSTLGRMMKLIEEAHSKRSDSEQWVEKFARIYTPIMMALSILIMIFMPLVLGTTWMQGVYQGLVILVIACPCALVISTPISVVSGLSAAARNGVLIKGGKYLELPAHLKAIAFDKTGTLTQGLTRVQEVVPLNNHSSDELLERAAALEAPSDHPLAQAILTAANEANISFSSCSDYRIIQGKGAHGTYKGKAYWLGSHRFLHEQGVETAECHERAEALEAQGHTVVAIGTDDHVCGLISIADGLREEAADTLLALDDLGVKTRVMLTGDNQGTADAIAQSLNLEVRAELLPEEKVDAVSALADTHGQIAMVGDGINDAPAMAAASFGIAMGAMGSDAAIETADIALMTDDLSKVPWLIRHSRSTLRIIKQNILFALGLKVLFIVMALAGVATLWMAIAADMGASLLVIANALRLLKVQV